MKRKRNWSVPMSWVFGVVAAGLTPAYADAPDAPGVREGRPSDSSGVASPHRRDAALDLSAGLFERAWAHSLAGQSVAARRELAAAERAAAQALFAGTPRLALSHRSDQAQDDRGARETEAELAVPLWWPGQRSARAALAAQTDARDLQDNQAARLALAGALRNGLWALADAQLQDELAQGQVEYADKLAADLARQVQAGEVAHADLLLARQEAASARLVAGQARRALQQARAGYTLLLGEPAPQRLRLSFEALHDAPPHHPRLAAAQAAVAQAHAALALARAERADPPELGLGYRRERDVAGEPTRGSVVLAVSFPLGASAQRAPALAAASVALASAQAELRRTTAELQLAEQAALEALEVARSAAELTAAQAQAARERLSLLERAQQLGELALAELLRARAQAVASELAAQRSQLHLGAAYAEVNQARGVLPGAAPAAAPGTASPQVFGLPPSGEPDPARLTGLSTFSPR